MGKCGKRQLKKEINNVLCHGTGGVLSSAASVICQRIYKCLTLLKDIDSYKFWEGAKQNKLFIQKSTKSKRYFFYSRSFSGVAQMSLLIGLSQKGKELFIHLLYLILLVDQNFI